jgi:hypothetical protein
MKKISLLLITILTLSACSSDDDGSSSDECSNTYDLLIGDEWITNEEGFANLRYDTDGKYYEDGEYDGTWQLSSDCQSIEYVTSEGLDWTWGIMEISENECVIGMTRYYR